MPTRADIVAAARACFGLRFQHQGRITAGIDCIGLLVLVARTLNVPHNDTATYKRFVRDGELHAGLLRAGLVEIPSAEAADGDVASFWYYREAVASHVGILATHEGRRTLIHTNAEVRKVVEQGLDGFWGEKLVKVYRFPGVV